MTDPSGERSSARFSLWVVLVLVALPYLTGLDNGFVWLDHSEIEDGTLVVRDWKAALGLFSEDQTTPGYHRPFYALLHSANFALWGLEPRGFLATSLGLHLANCALVFALLRRHGRGVGASASVAIFFGLHPVNTAVAGLIHATMDSLHLAAVLAAWLLFARGETGGRGRASRALHFGLSLLAFLIGLLSKENAFLYAPLVAAACFLPWRFADGTRPARGRLVAYALACALLAVAVAAGRGGELGATPPGGALPLGERLLTFAGVYVGYCQKLVWPFELSISDTVTRFSALGGRAQVHTLLSAAALVGGQLALFARVPRLRPWIVLLNVSLLPVAQLVPILHFRADRFLYTATFAAAGFAVECAGLAAEHLRARGWRESRVSRSAVVAVLLVAVACAARIPPRLARFESDETLFRAELELVPDYREGLAQLARHWDQSGRHEAATELYRESLTARPGRVSYLDVAGAVLAYSSNLLARGRVAEALDLVEGHRASPFRPRVREELEYNRAVALHRLGREAEALPLFLRYRDAHPSDPSCRYFLGRIAAALGQRALARESFERYLELAPNAPDRAAVQEWLAELAD